MNGAGEADPRPRDRDVEGGKLRGDRSWRALVDVSQGRRIAHARAVVRDGHLDGANGALLGTVTSNGGVNVLMGGGDRRGTASGKLAGNAGSGRWSGNATGASCSGQMDRAARLIRELVKLSGLL